MFSGHKLKQQLYGLCLPNKCLRLANNVEVCSNVFDKLTKNTLRFNRMLAGKFDRTLKSGKNVKSNTHVVVFSNPKSNLQKMPARWHS